MHGINYILSALADILWPPRCHICGCRPEPGQRWLCRHCEATLPRTRFNQWDKNPMAMSLAGKTPFVRAAAFLSYNPKGMLGPVFHDFKYHGFRHLARYMGTLAANDPGMRSFFDGVDFLLPVPMHPWKQLRRGYNQAAEIASDIGEEMNIPVGNCLTAISRHRTQTGMTAEQRARNISGIFRYRPHDDMLGKHICIVDDVCTTGATMLSCAEAIRQTDPSASLFFFSIGYTQ